ncbi:MAG TPA: tetratricopeptide repeat protein [Planctomycetota bacterium]|nr:tetratricopeptide repeat protein [Planctomycetota bacterium]
MTMPRLFFLLLTLSAALALGGEDADFRKAYGYYTLQEYALAVESLDKYLKENPAAERAEQARLLLAESRYQLKQYPQAAADYAQFLKDYPKAARRPEALLRAVKVNFLLKQYEKSLTAAENFLNENRPKLGQPDAHPALPTQIADALYYAGENAYALKNPELAKKHWEELIKSQPASKLIPDASDGLGSIHFDACEYEQALPRFQFTAKVPNHPRAAWARLMEARSLAALKKYDESLAALKSVPAGASKELDAELALRGAEIQLAAGKYAEALTAYKALAKDYASAPTTAPALAGAVYACMEAQRQAEAIALSDLYLAAAPEGTERASINRSKARALASMTDVPEALKAAKKAADDAAAITDPKRKAEEHPAALMLLAELSGPQGAEIYKQITQLYPETRFGLAARYETARLASQGGKLDDAQKEIQTLLDLLAKQNDPKLAELKRDALFAAGEFAFRKPDFPKCEEFLNAYRALAGENDPRGDDVARKLAWARHEQKDDASAAKILDEALQKFAKSNYRDEMLYLRALAAAKLGNTADSLTFIDKLLAETPASPFAGEALYDAASMLYKQQKFADAIGRLSLLIEKPEFAASPLRSAALQLRASALLQSGKFAEAQADSAAAIKAAGKDSAQRLPALRLIGALALLSQKDKPAEAEAALSEIIQQGPPAAPEVKQAMLRRAQLRFDAKKFAEAKADFAAAAGDLNQPLSPEALDAALRLALCHKELKETAEAKALLEKLAAQKLEGVASFEVPFQIGNFLFEAGDAAAAASSYEKALKAAESLKDLPPAARSAATLNLAWAYKRASAAEKSEKAFAEVLKLDPDGTYAAEALYERGRLLDELGKVEESQKAWQELVEKKADSPFAEKALLARSQSLAKSAKFADAAKGFEAYIQKFPKSQALREALLGLAESQLNAANSAAAKDAFMKVLGEKGMDADLDDFSERAMLGLSDISLKQGDSLNAKKMALRILTERPNSTWRDAAYFTAGQASEQLGEPQKAIGYYRKLLAEHPKSTHMDAATARLKALGAPVQ